MNENLDRPVDEAEVTALPLPYQASPRLRILVVDDDHPKCVYSGTAAQRKCFGNWKRGSSSSGAPPPSFEGAR